MLKAILREKAFPIEQSLPPFPHPFLATPNYAGMLFYPEMLTLPMVVLHALQVICGDLHQAMDILRRIKHIFVSENDTIFYDNIAPNEQDLLDRIQRCGANQETAQKIVTALHNIADLIKELGYMPYELENLMRFPFMTEQLAKIIRRDFYCSHTFELSHFSSSFVLAAGMVSYEDRFFHNARTGSDMFDFNPNMTKLDRLEDSLMVWVPPRLYTVFAKIDALGALLMLPETPQEKNLQIRAKVLKLVKTLQPSHANMICLHLSHVMDLVDFQAGHDWSIAQPTNARQAKKVAAAQSLPARASRAMERHLVKPNAMKQLVEKFAAATANKQGEPTNKQHDKQDKQQPKQTDPTAKRVRFADDTANKQDEQQPKQTNPTAFTVSIQWKGHSFQKFFKIKGTTTFEKLADRFWAYISEEEAMVEAGDVGNFFYEFNGQPILGLKSTADDLGLIEGSTIEATLKVSFQVEVLGQDERFDKMISYGHLLEVMQEILARVHNGSRFPPELHLNGSKLSSSLRVIDMRSMLRDGGKVRAVFRELEEDKKDAAAEEEKRIAEEKKAAEEAEKEKKAAEEKKAATMLLALPDLYLKPNTNLDFAAIGLLEGSITSNPKRKRGSNNPGSYEVEWARPLPDGVTEEMLRKVIPSNKKNRSYLNTAKKAFENAAALKHKEQEFLEGVQIRRPKEPKEGDYYYDDDGVLMQWKDGTECRVSSKPPVPKEGDEYINEKGVLVKFIGFMEVITESQWED